MEVPQQDYSVLYCDGYCKVGPESYGYARVTDKSGKCVMNQVININLEGFTKVHVEEIPSPLGFIKCVKVRSIDTPQQQIQYAEIMALYLALYIACLNKSEIVYTDSTTAIAWSKCSKKAGIKDKQKLKICELTQNLRDVYLGMNGKIIKIEGKNNLADFGYHNKSLLRLHKPNKRKRDEEKKQHLPQEQSENSIND